MMNRPEQRALQIADHPARKNVIIMDKLQVIGIETIQNKQGPTDRQMQQQIQHINGKNRRFAGKGDLKSIKTVLLWSAY